jgi:hypothetical protein
LQQQPQQVPGGPSTALATRPTGVAAAFDDVKMQKLWLAMQRHNWRSLAVIAGSKGLSTLELASTLAKIAWWYRGQPACVVDFRDLSLRLVEYQLREVAAQMNQGQKVIVALRSIVENPATILVANAVDAAVLCVRLGETQISAAEQTVNEIGREKFIGSIVLKNPHATVAHPGGAPAPANAANGPGGKGK